MIQTAQYTITTSPQVIVADNFNAEEVHIHTSGGTIYIGGSDVTSSNGLRLDNGDKKVLSNHVGAIYAVTATGTATIYVMVIEK